MSKQDYEEIAAVIRDRASSFKSNAAHAAFASCMAHMLREENPHCDRSRFILACMPRWMVGTNKANVWERIASNGA